MLDFLTIAFISNYMPLDFIRLYSDHINVLNNIKGVLLEFSLG